MEADSQISGNKTLGNKSYISFNYIYKKVMIQENYESPKSELRLLNYEKIAKYKMKNMNLKLLLYSILKIKNTLNINSPFLKYIKCAKPYNYTNIKINISQGDPILKEYYKNKNKNNKKFSKKEKILNFSTNKKSMKNFYFERMCNNEYKKINYNRNEKIILIQKHVRGYLRKKIIDEGVNKIIAEKIIKKILIIQRATRKLLYKKNSLNKLIVNIIQNERLTKGNKITDIFSLYHYRNIYKRNLIIQKILKARNDSILLIQNRFRTFIFIKKVKELIREEKRSYVLTYPFNAESVKIKIYMNTSYKMYNFFICPIRKYFVLYIDKKSINSGEYLCHIIVNNNEILDKRYKYIVDKNNNLFNLIYIGEPSLLKSPRSPINEIQKEDKKLQKERDKKDKKEKKEKKNKRKHRTEDDDSEDFFYYCYNDNSNSTNSYSTKSEHEKNKLLSKENKTRKKKEENVKINDLLKENKKNETGNIENYPSTSKFRDFVDINTSNIINNKISMKQYDFDKNFKYTMNKNEPLEYKLPLDIQNSPKEGSIQSQKIKYNNILDELSQSVSSTKSNFSMKNFNSFSKKTHQAKFCTILKEKISPRNLVLNNSSSSNNGTINTTINTTISSKKNKNNKNRK